MRRKYVEEKTRRRKLLLLLLAVAATTILLVNSLIGETGWLARRAQQKRIEALDTEVERIRNDNLNLSSHINNLKHDPGTIEEVAREQLRLGRSEDVVISLPKAPAAQ